MSTPADALDRLLSEPDFRDRIERFRRGGKALELSEVPEVLDRLMDLNATQLKALVERLGFSYRTLRLHKRVRWGPASAEQVLKLMAGQSRRGEIPATPREASRLIAACTAEFHRTDDPSSRAAVKRKRAELILVLRKLKKLPRRSGAGRIGFYLHTSLSARVFQHSDPAKQGQGGFINLQARGTGVRARFFSDYLMPHLGAGLTLHVGAKDRRTGRRAVDSILALPVLNTMHGGGYQQFSSTFGRQYGHSITGPYNLSATGGGHDPAVGRFLQAGKPDLGSVRIAERYVGIVVRLPARIAPGISIPRVNTRAVPGVGFGIEADGLGYLTFPILELAAMVGQVVKALARRLGVLSGSSV